MVHSWQLWATAALALSPLVAGTTHTVTVTASACQTAVPAYPTTVTETCTVTDTVTVPTTELQYTTKLQYTTVPTTTTRETTRTVSKCSFVPQTTVEYGGQTLVRRTYETCVFSTIVSTLTISTTYTVTVPTTTTTTKETTKETTEPTTVTKTVTTTKEITKHVTEATTVTKTVTTTKEITKEITKETTKPTTVTATKTTTEEITKETTKESTKETTKVATITATATIPQTLVVTSTALSFVTATSVLPPITVTLTREGSTVVTTIPGTTVTQVETVALPPVTRTIASVTISPAPACPAPSPPGLRGLPPSPKSNLKWGCEPGFVCSPPKPAGCAVWENAPPSDYLCEPQHCIPAPPLKRPQWGENQTGYYPPNPGYFNLDPRAFGLGFGIFEKVEVVEVVNGEPKTITTGAWGPQASLTVWPPDANVPRPTSKPSPTPQGYKTRDYDPKLVRDFFKFARNGLSRRQNPNEPGPVFPSVCFNPCNSAFSEAQFVGKKQQLCDPTSTFQGLLTSCLDCVAVQQNSTQTGARAYLWTNLVEYVTFCESTEPTNPGSSSAPGGVGTAITSFSTTDQGSATTGAPVPITTSASSSSETSTNSSSSSSQPTTPSTAESSTATTPASTTQESTSQPSTTTSSSLSTTSPTTASTSTPGTSTSTSTGLGPGLSSTSSSAASAPVASGTISRPPGTGSSTISRPSSVPTAGVPSSRKPALAFVFTILAALIVI